MSNTKFAILITTKNRLDALKVTLASISKFINYPEVECVICDDGSTDNTSVFISENYPQITLHSFLESKGYIHQRNFMLNNSKSQFAISLDDDAYFLSSDVLESIEHVFSTYKSCAVQAFRIHWDIETPANYASPELIEPVNGYVGCGHVWRMEYWNEIPHYPEWFRFYGEEQFASLQLHKNNYKIIYNSNVLVHHMADLKSRKSNSDFLKRQRFSLASGWFTILLCYPKRCIPKFFFYSFWSQLKRKTFKGNWIATLALILALFDVLLNSYRFITNKYRLSNLQFKSYQKLNQAKIYWKPNV